MTRGRPAILPLACLVIGALVDPALAAVRRPLALDDLFSLREVSDPRISPDGVWVAYVVGRPDREKDRIDSDIWMTAWDGTRTVRLTTSPRAEHTPRWSPDDRYLAFISDREDDREKDQVWLLDRAGGEAERLTDFRGGVSDFVWSPDSERLAIVARDPRPEDIEVPGKQRTPTPIVIDRFQFKQDEEGYLGAGRHHVYLYDVTRRRTGALTPGPYDEFLPSWSPDGASLAFVSKRGGDVDRHNNWDVYVIDARPGARARRLTTDDAPDADPENESRPVWSPDGSSIAYLYGGDPRLTWYAIRQLAVIPAAGGRPRLLAPELDRSVAGPRWSPDGSALYFLLEDDGNVYLARIPATGGTIERLTDPRRVVSGFDVGRGDRLAILTSTPGEPYEVAALEGGEPRLLSRHNEALLADLRLGTVEEIRFRSGDGTEIHGFVVIPPSSRKGEKLPAILRIHGGPVSQFENEFRFDWQLIAAAGYLVVAANPRGSSGRGETFQRAIWADWGNRDAQDVLAAVDHVVKSGMADPKRLGIGGWSYGGMLTNYTIARDTRFRAATSGSGISNILAGYGTDQYVRDYELELGVPWRNLDVWLRLSFPFLHAERIVTPTLFLCGEKDFNVPLLNSEQMYQALRSLDVDTQLVIYPGEYHGIKRPSFRRDRLQRYLSWYDRYLMPGKAPKR